MKEATGETSMTVVTIIAVAAIAAIVAAMWPMITNWISDSWGGITNTSTSLTPGSYS